MKNVYVTSSHRIRVIKNNRLSAVNSLPKLGYSANVDDVRSKMHRLCVCYSAILKADKVDASRKKDWVRD